MSEIKLDNGYKLTRSGAFQAKGVEAALKEIAGNDQIITATELTQANFSSDAKTAFFAKMLTTQMAGNPFEITESSVSDLEDKMEKAWAIDKNKPTSSPSATQNVGRPTVIATPKAEATKKTTKSEEKGFFMEQIDSMKKAFTIDFYTNVRKSESDIREEGWGAIKAFTIIGAIGGPIGMIAGAGLGIAATAIKLMVKEFVAPEPINKPTITFDDEDLKDQAKAHDAKRGNRFDEKYVPKPNFLDTLKK
jgi:hypothetical protein